MRVIYNVFEVEQRVFEKGRAKILKAIELSCKADVLLSSVYDQGIQSPDAKLTYNLYSVLVEPARENKFRLVKGSTSSMHASYINLVLEVDLMRHNPTELRIENSRIPYPTNDVYSRFALLKGDDCLHMESERAREEILKLVGRRLDIIGKILQDRVDGTSNYPIIFSDGEDSDEREVCPDDMIWRIRTTEAGG